ncbi:hypothetical protein R6Q57_004120 [Mikania cordata]
MTWCLHCSKYTDTHFDYTTGSVCCVECGKLVSHDIYTEDLTFVKDAAGGTHLAGNQVKSTNPSYESHRRTLNKGNDVIYELIGKHGISNVNHATKYYQIAVERGFTKGRRTGQVAAACLYVACREMEKPFLLIEFSSELGVSVYELGTVYLQLCKLLSLQDHPFVQKPVDPSLFMHRYTSVPHLEKLDKIGDSVDTFESSKEAPADESLKEASADESDTLSDIDDSEIIGYLHDEEESRLKKIIWEHVNREHVQQEAAKEAAAAAARKLYMGSSEEIREAQALAAAAAQVVASKKEKDKRKRELEAKNAKPAQTAAEAAGQHFKKRLSSKINYDVLNDLFGDKEPSQEENHVEAGSDAKAKELENEDNNDFETDDQEDHEWKYDNELQISGYVDDYYEEY